MIVLNVRNVNHALTAGIRWLQNSGVSEHSRNGRVIVSPCPVVTVYEHPRERVLFSPVRDANPFFHIMEALWMLNGSDDLAWPLYFNSKFSAYSDNGRTLHGAYGFRWRYRFGYDQLDTIVDELKSNPTTRRAVLTMWDAGAGEDGQESSDLHVAIAGGKDVPCNTHAYIDVRGGVLNITVCCRSNDIIWGAYGANAVHFSMLQEYLAACVGVPVGVYRQISNNFHVYPDNLNATLDELAMDATSSDYYCADSVRPSSLVQDPVQWRADLEQFMVDPTTSVLYEPFFNHVAQPMYKAYKVRKEHTGNGLAEVDEILALDWSMACRAWVNRRERAKQAAVPEGRPSLG